MKKTYKRPEVMISRFSTEDIITSSNISGDTSVTTTPIIETTPATTVSDTVTTTAPDTTVATTPAETTAPETTTTSSPVETTAPQTTTTTTTATEAPASMALMNYPVEQDLEDLI